MQEKVAQRYAQTLFETGKGSNQLPVLQRDLKLIAEILEQSPELERFLNNPVIPAQKRQSVLQEIFSGKIDAVTFKFLLFLANKRRLAYLKTICLLFERLYDDAQGILKTQWTTSVALSEAESNMVRDFLKKKFKKEIQVEHKVDANVLGGIKIQIGDTIHDYTIQAQLKKFKHNLIGV